jgi:hypothetical protein
MRHYCLLNGWYDIGAFNKKILFCLFLTNLDKDVINGLLASIGTPCLHYCINYYVSRIYH